MNIKRHEARLEFQAAVQNVAYATTARGGINARELLSLG